LSPPLAKKWGVKKNFSAHSAPTFKTVAPPLLSPPELDYYPTTTQSTSALSGSGVPCSGVDTPAAAVAGEGPSTDAQLLHSLQPHAITH